MPMNAKDRSDDCVAELTEALDAGDHDVAVREVALFVARRCAGGRSCEEQIAGPQAHLVAESLDLPGKIEDHAGCARVLSDLAVDRQRESQIAPVSDVAGGYDRRPYDGVAVSVLRHRPVHSEDGVAGGVVADGDVVADRVTRDVVERVRSIDVLRRSPDDGDQFD